MSSEGERMHQSYSYMIKSSQPSKNKYVNNEKLIGMITSEDLKKMHTKKIKVA